MVKRNYPEGRYIHIRLLPETHKLLRIRTAEEDTNMQEYVVAVLEKALKRRRKK
ncbi:MAG: hypothetical protein KAT58_00915 [candidate division Zixibacteria bacterium]|nr:hypothetical protein [candidate division Zixibacteria bacterium]